MKLKIVLWPLVIIGMFLFSAINAAFAWNPVTDLKQNWTWTLGKKAEVGLAVKLTGAGDLAPGETATSMLAGVADYHFLSFSYGGTRINKADQNFTDTAKVGLRLNSFFDWFNHQPTNEMQFLRNLNIGPSYAVSVLSKPHSGTLFLDVNYQWGN